MNRVYLFDDNLTDWTPINGGDYGAVGNSHCSVYGDGNGFTSVNNTTARLSLSMTFWPSFLGTKYYDQEVKDQLGNDSLWGTIPGTLTVTPPLNLSAGSGPSALVGVFFSQTLSGDATGGTPPYNWTATGLPPGMSFSSNGMLSGTPTASGTYYPAVTVTDSSITPARAGPTGYVVSVRFPPTIITSSQLQGFAGVPFSQSFAATGGVPPYTWSVQSGSTLPAGLTLSYAGTLSGTNGGGAFSFTVKVTDSNGVSAEAPFSLSIGYFTVPPIISVTIPSGAPSATFDLPVTSVNRYYNQGNFDVIVVGIMHGDPGDVVLADADGVHGCRSKPDQDRASDPDAAG